jgi:hypothetical protein
MIPTHNTRIKKRLFLAHPAQTAQGREGHIVHPKNVAILLQCTTSSAALKHSLMPKRLRHVADISTTMSAAVLVQQRTSTSTMPAPGQRHCHCHCHCHCHRQRQPMSASVPAPSSVPALSSAPAPAPSAPVLAHPPATLCNSRCIVIAISPSPKRKRSGTSNATQVPGMGTESAAASALALKPAPLPLHALATKHAHKQHIQLQRCILQGPGKLYCIIFSSSAAAEAQLQQQQ